MGFCGNVIAWDQFTWEAFATLVTGILAVGSASWVALRQIAIQNAQTEIQKRKLAFDLFDKRYKIYEAVERFIVEICKHAAYPSDDIQREFLVALGESRFVFSDYVRKGIDEIWEKALSFGALTREMKQTYQREGHYGDGNPDKEHQALLWFSEKLTKLPELFAEMKPVEQTAAG